MKNKLLMLLLLMLFLVFSSCLLRDEKSYIIRDPNYKNSLKNTQGTNTVTDTQQNDENKNAQLSNKDTKAVDLSKIPNCHEIAKEISPLNSNIEIIEKFSKCEDKSYLLLGDDDSVLCALNNVNSNNLYSNVRLIKFFVMNQKIYKIYLYGPKSSENLKDKEVQDVKSDLCVSLISNQIQNTQAMEDLFKALIIVNNFFYFEKSEKITLCYNVSSLSILDELLSFMDLSLKSLKRNFEKKCDKYENERHILEILNEKSKTYKSENANVICFEKNKVKDLKSLNTIFGKYYWNYQNCENLVAEKLLIVDNRNELKGSLLKEYNVMFLFRINYDSLVVNGKINETLVASLLNFSYYLNKWTKDKSKNEEMLRYLKIVKEQINPTIIIPESSDKLINEFITKNFFNETLLSLKDVVFPSFVHILYSPISEKETLSSSLEDLKKILEENKDLSCTLESDLCRNINQNSQYFKNYSYLIEYLSYKNKKLNPYLLYSFVFIKNKNDDICKKSENLVDDILEISTQENVLKFIENKFNQNCLGLIVAYSWFFSFVYLRPNYDFSRIEKKDVTVNDVKYKITPKSTEELFKFCNDEIKLNDEDINLVQILLKSKDKELIINKDKKLEEGITFDDEFNKIKIFYDTSYYTSRKVIILECIKKIKSEIFKETSIVDELIVKYNSINPYNIYHKKFSFSLAELSLEGKENEELKSSEAKCSYNFNITGFGDNVNSLQDALNVFNEIKFNGENIKETIRSFKKDNLNINIKFENRKLIFEVNVDNCKDNNVLHNFEFSYLDKKISISKTINYIKSIIVEGKLLAKLGKLNNNVEKSSKKIDVPLSNMNITITVNGKEYSSITDSDGNFKIILDDVSLIGKKVDVTFFYQRLFLDKIKVEVNYSAEPKDITEEQINTVKSNKVFFNISFNNFCNENDNLYQCKENKNVEFNLTINNDNNDRFESNVEKEHYESIFYTYHFLEQVVDFYTELVKDDSTIKNSEVSNLEVVVAPNVHITNVGGLFHRKRMYLFKLAYFNLPKYLFVSLAHEFTHIVLELKHQLFEKQYKSFEICSNSQHLKKDACSSEVTFQYIKHDNYGGIMNPSTVDSVNEALARVIEKIILEDFYLKKEQSLYEKGITLSKLIGEDLELNRIPYDFNKDEYDLNEILSIASFFNDLLDDTNNEIILSNNYIQTITGKLNQNFGEQNEIKDEVFVDYNDFLKKIILKNYGSFNFYEIYKEISTVYSSEKEKIEKIAKANLLYYNARSGNKEIGKSYKIYDLACNFNYDPCNVEDIRINENCILAYKYSGSEPSITKEDCQVKGEKKSSINQYPCQLFSNYNECVYELYTFVYNKSQQGEVGIISFEGHYLKDKRRKVIKEYPTSQILIKDPVSDVYIVEVRFLENYGIENYSYLQKLDEENKLYIHPIPHSYLAEIRVKPYFDEENLLVTEYIINSRVMNEKIMNSDKDYFDEVKFKIVSEEEKTKEESIENESRSVLKREQKDKYLNLLIVSVVIIFSVLIFVYLMKKKEHKHS